MGVERKIGAGVRSVKTKRFRLVMAVAAAIAPMPQAFGADTYSLNADGPNGGGSVTIDWNTAAWTGGPNAYPGFNAGVTDDIAVVSFREFNNVDGTGDPAPTVNLGGNTYTLGSLSVSESGTGNTDGNFANGTLNLASLVYTSGGREIDFETNLTLNGNGAGGGLSITSTGNNIDILGTISSATALTYSNNGTQFLRIARAEGTTSKTGALASLTQAAGAAFVIQFFDSTAAGVTAGLDQFTLGSLTFNNVGKFELDRVNGSAAFGVTVTGATTINPVVGARLRLDANDGDAFLTLSGALTIDNDGNGVEVGSEDQRSVININGGIVDGGQNDVLTIVQQGSLSSANVFGTVNINNVASSRTAATILTGGRVNLNVNNGLGTGNISVRENAHLQIGAVQNSLNITVSPFGVIGGDLTNATYGGGGNVTLPASNAIIVGGTVNAPTTNITGGAVHLLGIAANTGTFAIGDDGNPGTTNDIYRGVAFGTFAASGNFTGTITPTNGTADFEVYMQAGKVFGVGGTATINTSGAINFTGPGLVQLNEPDATGTTRAVATLAAGGADVYNRIGEATLSQNATILRFADASSLVGGQTINVTHGRVDLDVAGAVAAGAVVNIGVGATLSLDQTPSTGTFNINSGGALAINSSQLEGGATFNASAGGGLLILDGDFAVPATGTLISIMPQMDLVLHDADADAFTGAGLVLGQGKRLTTPSTSSIDLSSGAGITAASGVTNVILSASTGDTLDINDAVNLPGVDVQVNSDPFNTIVSGGTGGTNFTRVVDTQNGTVALNTTSARSIDVSRGLLRFEQGAIAGLKDGSITSAVGGVGGATTIREGATVELEYNQETAATGIQIDEVFVVSGDSTNAGGRQFILDRNGTVTGGNNIISLNNVHLQNNTVLGVDVQDTTSTEGRFSLRLVGTATTAEQTLTGADMDEFALKDVSGINADGSVNLVDPRTLLIGQTPVGTTPGLATPPNSASFVTAHNVYGRVAANVSVNVINGQLTFEDGSAIDGTVSSNLRTGESILRINAGRDGNVANRLTGIGTITMGNDSGTTVEELSGFVNEVDTALGATTPLYNTTTVRVNVLNRTSIGGGNRAILRAERGTDAAAATDLPGTFEYGAVHLEAGAIATLESSNEARVVANFNLDQDAIVEANSGTNAYIRNVTDPGSPSALIIRGSNALRAIGTITADRVVVGGPLASNGGTLILQNTAAQSETIASVNYPRLAGPASSAVLNLSQFIAVGQGGNLDVGDAGVGVNGPLSIASGLSLSGNGDVDIYVPLSIPAGKRLTGNSSTAIQILNSGSLSIATDGILAPGTGPGTLTIAGSVALETDAIYEYEIGVTPATSDLLTLTGTGTTVTLGSSLDLLITNVGGVDPAGNTYVLFDYTGANPVSLPAINFVGPLTGDVSIDTANTRIVLTNVVPEPSAIALAALMGCGLLARRRVGCRS